MRTGTEDAELARALDAPAALLDYLPHLYQDLPDLSGACEDATRILEACGFPRGGSILDLGCGRGEFAIAAAQRFAARVTGIDALAAFVEIAQERAEAAAIASRCRFLHGDLRNALAAGERYDAVAMLALGPVLGDAAATVAELRKVAVSGGLIIVDDAYLRDGAAPPPGYEAYGDRAATHTAITAHGDRIEVWLEGVERARAYNAAALSAIEVRAAELGRRHPELTRDLADLLAIQRRETALMEGPVVPVLWALRRA